MIRIRFVVIILTALLAGVLPAPQRAFAQEAGYALRFDGVSDFVRLPETSRIIGAGWATAKTVSLWIKPTGAAICTSSDPGSCDAIVGDRPRTWGISRGTLGGRDRIWVWNYDGTFDRIGLEYTPGEWLQVALVHDGVSLTAYKNGAPVATVTSGPTMQITGQVIYFGGVINNTSRNWTFEGEIDELQIWSVVRPASEVATDSARGLNGTESGLAAYYRMSDGSGAVLTDNSGHGWSGILTDGGSGVPADGPILWVPSGAFGGGGVPMPNEPPVAFGGDLATAEDSPTAVTLTGDDPDGDALTFRIISAPSFGVLSGAAPNLTYSPNGNYHGNDSFTFVTNDGHVDSAPATVSITITGVNDPPTAVDDSASTQQDTAITVPVLANDADADGDALSLSAGTAPSNGNIVVALGEITYTPNDGFIGTDSFSYTVADPFGLSSEASVTVTIRPPGPDPGYALRFDGVSDFVTLAQTAYILPPGWETSKTVSLWVKPTETSFCNAPSPASCDAIFGDRPRWWGISRGVIGGVDRIWVWNYDGNYRIVGVDYTPGEWMHVALVHGGGALSAYKNGVLVGSVTSGATQQPSTGALPVLHLGGIINTVTRNWTFSGEIDEVQIWSTARTPAEVLKDMSEPLTGSEAGLAAYYRMTDGAGSGLTDDSGYGWLGTLTDGGQGVPADGPIAWVLSGAFVIFP